MRRKKKQPAARRTPTTDKHSVKPAAAPKVNQPISIVGVGASAGGLDVFLRSLAEDQESRAIGVILSGTASDGTLGLRAIKAVGGVTFAQDESAKYSAMPRSAAASGNVDFVLAPGQIARELSRIAQHI